MQPGEVTQQRAEYDAKGNELKTSRRASTGAQSGGSYAAGSAERREGGDAAAAHRRRLFRFGGHARTALWMHVHGALQFQDQIQCTTTNSIDASPPRRRRARRIRLERHPRPCLAAPLPSCALTPSSPLDHGDSPAFCRCLAVFPAVVGSGGAPARWWLWRRTGGDGSAAIGSGGVSLLPPRQRQRWCSRPSHDCHPIPSTGNCPFYDTARRHPPLRRCWCDGE